MTILPLFGPLSKISLAFLLLVFSSSTVVASEHANAVKQIALEKRLSEHRLWSRMLYYEVGEKKSAVKDAAYFFDPRGNIDKEKELLASIDAYFLPWPEDRNRHAICRFPGRYYWLNQHLDLPDFDKMLDESCSRLKVWAYYKKAKSISLMLVSGYLGNPASSFGHSFLKINLGEQDSNLFDKSLNYGAVVPPDESILRYIFFGITGGYDGRFTNEYFFTQDRVYSRTEFRDMWEYKLDLSEEQLDFLMLHLWDISGRQFQYFFFDKNCAYRISQLIEMLGDVELSKSNRPWYLPETLFHKLIDNQSELIADVKFIPSSQRVLYTQMELLRPEERKIIEGIHKNKHISPTIWSEINSLGMERRIIFFDVLLAYHKYLLTASGNRKDKFMLDLEREVLLARLALPSREREYASVEYLKSPAQGNKASSFGLGVFDADDDKGFLVSLAAYKKDLTTNNSLQGNELVLLDLEYHSSENGGQVHFDLIKASNLKPSSSYLSSEKTWAWQINMGAHKAFNSESYNGFFKGSMGKSRYLYDQLFVYALFGPQFYSQKPSFDVSAKVGFVHQGQRFNIEGYKEIGMDEEVDVDVVSLNYNFFFKRNVNILFGVSDFGNREMLLETALNFHF